jgi:hypothetical protein
MNKTGQELYSEYKSLQKKVDGLDKKITERLLFLSKKYPEAIIGNINGVDIKAQTITDYRNVIQTHYNVKARITYIINIEKWLKTQNPYKQLSLFDGFGEDV